MISDPRLDDLVIDPSVEWEAADAQPLRFVDLAACPADWAPAPPPFPLIGLGDLAHPHAQHVDAVVEPPVSAERLVRHVSANPHAAAVAVRLLRSIEELDAASALPFESLAYGLLQGSGEHAAWLGSRKRAEPAPPGRIAVTRDGAVLSIVLDRPEARNAIDRAMRDALHDAFTVAELDPDLCRVELRAVGPAFSVGADLDEFGTTRDPAIAHFIRSKTLPAWPLSRRADIFDVHVQGACVGAGLEIAAFAGRVTASPSAWFQLPELAMGLIPGAGGCVSVSRRIGRQRAALMILSGRRINAATALDWGLVDAVEDHPPADPRSADTDRG